MTVDNLFDAYDQKGRVMESDCVTQIDGWITPRMEQILKRAAAISAERGYNYLGV